MKKTGLYYHSWFSNANKTNRIFLSKANEWTAWTISVSYTRKEKRFPHDPQGNW